MIGIINCDLDESALTNGGHLINQIIDNSEIIDITKGENLNIDFGYDGIIITGSRADYNDDHEWITRLKEYILKIRDRNIPCLGICFGMQIITHIFQGKIIENKIKEEGFHEIEFKKSRLFYGVTSPMVVYEAHHDTIITIPEGAKLTAINKNCVQGFKFENYYCLQFHPEISAHTIVRMAQRDGEDVSKKLNGVSGDYKLPEKILHNFVKICSTKNFSLVSGTANS